MSVVDVRTRLPPLKVPVSLEPILVAVGAMHVAAASASGLVAVHRCLPEDHQRVTEAEYGKVKDVVLNDKYAAILAADGTLTLHELEPGLSVVSPGPNPNHASQPTRRKVSNSRMVMLMYLAISGIFLLLSLSLSLLLFVRDFLFVL